MRQGKDLAGVPLLELTTEHWQGKDWELWLKQAKLETTQLNIQCFFNDYVMLQSAAELGLGVGLGWSHLCDQALQSGRLVAPLRNKVATSPGSGYQLSAMAKQAHSEVQAVQAWLLQQAQIPSA